MSEFGKGSCSNCKASPVRDPARQKGHHMRDPHDIYMNTLVPMVVEQSNRAYERVRTALSSEVVR